MDLTQLFGPTMVFGLACYFLSLGIRAIAERYWKGLMSSWFWQEVLLRLLPALVGIGLVFGIPKFPFPTIFMTSLGSKAMFGAVAGILSTWVYSIAKATVKRVWGVDVDNIQVIVQKQETTTTTATVATETATTTTAIAVPIDPDKTKEP